MKYIFMFLLWVNELTYYVFPEEKAEDYNE